jgi:hypothetical protein
VSPGIELVEFIRNGMADEASVPRKNPIRTEANLTSSVLARICSALGLDPARYELKNNLIDEELLRRRNEIAHGQFELVELDDFEQLYTAVTELIEDIRTEITNHAVLGRYRVA